MEGKLTEELRSDFEEYISALRGIFRVVTVGDVDCGKTEIISRFMGPCTSVQRRVRPHYNEYRITLDQMPCFPILIHDARDIEYFEGNIHERTVYILCYDVDKPETFQNLESIWLPKLRSFQLEKKFYYTVGIDSGENGANSNAAAGIDRQQQKADLHLRAEELMRQTGDGLAIQSSFESYDDIANALQSAQVALYLLASQD